MILIHSARGVRAITSGLAALLMIASPFFCDEARAQGEHARRIGAELLVLVADLRMLEKGEVASHHARGLRERIQGGVVALDILCRLADQEAGIVVRPRDVLLSSMRADLQNNRLSSLLQTLTTLSNQYPLLLPDIQPQAGPQIRQLHDELCAGCHDKPDLSVARPAYNLSAQRADSSELDMFARMLVGVRGERITGIDNPLSDYQILGLMDYYNAAEQDSLVNPKR